MSHQVQQQDQIPEASQMCTCASYFSVFWNFGTDELDN